MGECGGARGEEQKRKEEKAKMHRWQPADGWARRQPPGGMNSETDTEGEREGERARETLNPKP